MAEVTGKNLAQLSAILKSSTNNGLGTPDSNAWQSPRRASTTDLLKAIDWLLSYEWEDDAQHGSAFINVAEMLSGEVLKRYKKHYAKTHGIKVSQVKFKEAQ
jgi:hypothetical protein